MLDWRMICAAALFGMATPGLAQVGPKPTNPEEWITAHDYPAAAISNEDEGRVTFKLSVSPEGTVTGCKTTGGTAPDNLKQLTCQLVRERARFKPASNSKGDPAEGTYEATVAWEIPAAGEVPSKTYALPPIPFWIGADVPHPEPGRTEIVMTIRPDGTVADCTWETSGGAVNRDLPEGLLNNFCEGFSFAPFSDGSGTPKTFRILTTIEEIENE
ncbi:MULTISPECIES: TonB family protein [Sphingomonadales]|uniref:TonB family protein n=1 Tax=Sphingomonadales TaxID=204457 RepID=UPI0001DD0FE5|nr:MULTISPECIES: TonB family protein [Sphingomonadales]